MLILEFGYHHEAEKITVETNTSPDECTAELVFTALSETNEVLRKSGLPQVSRRFFRVDSDADGAWVMFRFPFEHHSDENPLVYDKVVLTLD